MTIIESAGLAALINELLYCKQQQAQESISGAEALTPHDITLSVNGIDSKIESTPSIVDTLHQALSKELQNAMYEREIKELKDFIDQLNTARDAMEQSSYEPDGDAPEIPVHIEIAGKKISPLFCANVYNQLLTLATEELKELEG